GLRPVFQVLLSLLFIFTACTPQTATPAPAAATDTPAAAAPSGPLAPDGDPNQTYYAPFPVKITLDGDLKDWQGVPTVTIPAGADPNNANQPSLTFAAAADDKYMYMM